MRAIKKAFAILIAAPLFVFLAYVFGVFLNPQGGAGLVAALVLITISALVSLFVYGWIMRGAPIGQLNPGIDDGKGVGLGLLGSAQDRRRRDETDGDDFGGRRGSGRDTSGGSTDDDPSGII